MRFILNGITLMVAILFLGLTSGFEFYRVHCNMRGATFVSLQTGMDPCLLENVVESKSESCCSKKEACGALQKDDDGCCQEEEIVVSYEPDAFNQIHIFLPEFVDVYYKQCSPLLITERNIERIVLAQYPQPPPLRGTELLTLHCIWRI